MGPSDFKPNALPLSQLVERSLTHLSHFAWLLLGSSNNDKTATRQQQPTTQQAKNDRLHFFIGAGQWLTVHAVDAVDNEN